VFSTYFYTVSVNASTLEPFFFGDGWVSFERRGKPTRIVFNKKASFFIPLDVRGRTFTTGNTFEG